jgi:peptidoglycan/xylan/chitin deacetylase (PgdA/CDA1 family)/membrane-bound metal-dependent hydrolase YbcI (DUF457 family)
MDPVTHVLVGAALAKSYRAPRFHFWMLAALAELPDFDVFFGWFGFHGLLSMHRSWTHSFLAAGLAGCAAWVLLRKIGPWEGFRGLAAYLTVSASHVLCDWMTSYGTPVFWPFSSANFSLDWVSNLSLGPLTVLAGGLLLSKIWREKGRWILPATWVVLGLFIAASVILHAEALGFAKAGDHAFATPDLVNPLYWRVIDADDSLKEYKVFKVRPLSKRVEALGAYPMPAESPWIQASLSSPRVRLFLRNDRWPVAKVIPFEGGAEVDWGNLLFFWAGRLRGKLVVDLDAQGHVTSTRRLREVWPALALEPGDFVTHGPTSAKRVALSFDDGPGPFTPRVLDILRKNAVHATFFMNGDQVKIRPQFAKRVTEEGHEIGDHTYSHRNFYTYKATDPVVKLKAQMSLSKEVIRKTTGVSPVLCRMPYGYSKAWVRPIAREHGYVLVNWTFGCDWTQRTPEAKRTAYIKHISPGAIFLMHDGGVRREGTLYALEGLIEELKARGYEIVTVGELIGIKE